MSDDPAALPQQLIHEAAPRRLPPIVLLTIAGMAMGVAMGGLGAAVFWAEMMVGQAVIAAVLLLSTVIALTFFSARLSMTEERHEANHKATLANQRVTLAYLRANHRRLEETEERQLAGLQELGALTAQLQQLEYGQRKQLTTLSAWIMRLAEKVDVALVQTISLKIEEMQAELDRVNAEQGALRKKVEEGGMVMLDMPNSDVYEFGKQIGREEAERKRGNKDQIP